MKNKYININTLVSLVIGFFICYIFLFLAKACDFSTDNIINLSSIIINLIIAGFIVLFLQKKYADGREVKNYLINELKQVQTEYKEFSNKLIYDKVDGKFILSWFKVINVKLGHLKFFMKDELEIDDDRLNVLIQDIRLAVTKSDSFNNTFSSPKIVLSQRVKNSLLESNKNINHCFIGVIIKIHKK